MKSLCEWTSILHNNYLCSYVVHRYKSEKMSKMGILMKLADAITVLFLTIVTVVGLFTNGHVFLPSHYYLKSVIDNFIRDKKHYLLLEKPDFFRALLYYHLLVNWPLAVISLYGFIFRKSWIRTTSLILAVSLASITVSLLFWIPFFPFLKMFDCTTIYQLKTPTFNLL